MRVREARDDSCRGTGGTGGVESSESSSCSSTAVLGDKLSSRRSSSGFSVVSITSFWRSSEDCCPCIWAVSSYATPMGMECSFAMADPTEDELTHKQTSNE